MHGKASSVRLARLFLQPTKNKICVKKSCTKRAEKMSTFHENRKSTRQARHLLGFMRCCWQRTSLILVSPYSILVRIFNWNFVESTLIQGFARQISINLVPENSCRLKCQHFIILCCTLKFWHIKKKNYRNLILPTTLCLSVCIAKFQLCSWTLFIYNFWQF